MKPKHQRLIFIAVSMVLLCFAVIFTLNAFKSNLVFFFSPSEIPATGVIGSERLVRIGGLVETGSIQKNDDGRVNFILTDGKASIQVEYKGILPNLFRDGQGTIAEGYLSDIRHMRAIRILTKHDENYIPKEVVDALKRSGRWQEGGPSAQ